MYSDWFNGIDTSR